VGLEGDCDRVQRSSFDPRDASVMVPSRRTSRWNWGAWNAEPSCCAALARYPGKDAVADARRWGLAAAHRGDRNARGFALFGGPFHGASREFAVAVAAGDLEHAHFSQVGGAFQFPVPALDRAVGGEVFEQGFQRNAGGAGDAEVARDLALAGLSGMFGDEGEHLLAGGKLLAVRPVLLCFRVVSVSQFSFRFFCSSAVDGFRDSRFLL